MKYFLGIMSLVILLSTTLCAESLRSVQFFQRVVSDKEGVLFEGKTWLKDGQVCVEFESGSDLYTSVIKNGKVYNFSTVSSAGTVAPIKRNPQFQFGPEVLQSKIHLKAYLTSVNAKVTGEETYQGQRCFVYKYDYSDGESQVLNTLWVWKKAFFPLKTEMRINSNDIVTIYYDAVRINDDIADRRFDLPKNIRFYSE